MNNTVNTTETAVITEVTNITVAIQTIVELRRQLTGGEGRDILARAKAHLEAQQLAGCIQLAEMDSAARGR